MMVVYGRNLLMKTILLQNIKQGFVIDPSNLFAINKVMMSPVCRELFVFQIAIKTVQALLDPSRHLQHIVCLKRYTLVILYTFSNKMAILSNSGMRKK